jgi:serine/threonine protein kinase
MLKSQRQSKTIQPNTIAKCLSNRETLEQTIENLAVENATAVGDDVINLSDIEDSLLPFRSDLNIASFEIGSSLGRGKFGHVFLARHRTTSYICALKIIYKAQIADSKEEMLIRRELEIHQNLAHPNILRFLSWFHDETRVFLILEYAPGGNLYDLLLKQPKHRFNERYAAQYIAQIAEALRYMHNKNVMHRDIKPENILLGLHNEIKLADFGYSVHSISGLRSTVCGTLDYISPEVAIMHIKPGKAKEFYTKAVDQWSLGILTYELLTGKPPFEMKSGKATEKKIANFKGKVHFPAHVSQPAIDFILEVSCSLIWELRFRC